MGLLPGILLLISSHFIPPPRSSSINAFSSGDHFDCFLAGRPRGDASCNGLLAEDPGRDASRAPGISGEAVETDGLGRVPNSESDGLGDAVAPPAVVVVLVASFSSS
ncbi:hypothetical protein D8B26_000833 [Coccidioides posadasii str. Silveira]|uniref:uncharacterized protein n=1 Tax=Coccidioides posadasii (strain RMSCC 757 / Silveira) TaxID=443226 RepID=UPI001BEFA4D7|nr:hypothetical protein D8B26_000833 [Coccidioides posadasii str. Silveira]